MAILLGLSPLGGTGLHEQSHELARSLQGVGAYPEDPESNRDRELLAVGEMHALSRQALDRVAENMFPGHATELLSMWESYLRVPNNAARTIQERQRWAEQVNRLAIGTDLASLKALTDELASAKNFTPTQANVSTSEARAECVMHFLTTISETAFADERRGFMDLIVRMLPARAIGALSREGDITQHVATSIVPTWDDASDYMGRTALAADTAGNADRVPCRFREYGPYTLLQADDLNGIQDASLFGGGAPDSSTGNIVPASEIAAGALYRFFAISIPNGTIVELDTSDWRDRVCVLSCRASATDIRPGSVDDDTCNDTGNHVDPMNFYTASGDGGSFSGDNIAAVPGAGTLSIRAEITSGALQMWHGDGVTKYVVGCVYAIGQELF